MPEAKKKFPKKNQLGFFVSAHRKLKMPQAPSWPGTRKLHLKLLKTFSQECSKNH
jgi:hypothetical protein